MTDTPTSRTPVLDKFIAEMEADARGAFKNWAIFYDLLQRVLAAASIIAASVLVLTIRTHDETSSRDLAGIILQIGSLFSANALAYPFLAVLYPLATAALFILAVTAFVGLSAGMFEYTALCTLRAIRLFGRDMIPGKIHTLKVIIGIVSLCLGLAVCMIAVTSIAFLMRAISMSILK